MKAFALNGRDKPKDAYDICYCLDHFEAGISELARAWRERKSDETDVQKAIVFLQEKFESVDCFGPMQVVEFYNDPDADTRDGQSRRSYELVQNFLREIESEEI